MNIRLHLALIAGFTAPVVAQDAPLTPEQREVFALLDTLDPYDTSNLPFVRIIWPEHNPSPMRQRYGFLVAGEGRSLRVRHLNGGSTLVRVGRAANGNRPVRFEPVDLATAMREVARNVGRMRGRGARTHPIGLRTRLLLLARACGRIGRYADVQYAWDLLPPRLSTVNGLLEDDDEHDSLAHATAHQLAIDFADPSITWHQLETRHDRWLESFATSFFGRRVRERLAGIRRTRARIAAFDASIATAEATEVFQLRNEHWLFEDTGALRGWAVLPPTDRPARGSSVHERILANGLACVPALIAALGDSDLTRCICYRVGDVRIDTVGTLAERLLVRIAGYLPVGDDRGAAWRAWFAAVQQQGMQAVMEGEVAKRNAPAIETYLRRWPEQLPRVVAAIDAKSGTSLGAVLAMLRALPDPLPEPALVACERILSGPLQPALKRFVATALVDRTCHTGGNALRELLGRDAIEEATRKALRSLLR